MRPVEPVEASVLRPVLMTIPAWGDEPFPGYRGWDGQFYTREGWPISRPVTDWQPTPTTEE